MSPSGLTRVGRTTQGKPWATLFRPLRATDWPYDQEGEILRPNRGFPIALARLRHLTKFSLETIHAVLLRCFVLLVSVAFANRNAGINFVNRLI